VTSPHGASLDAGYKHDRRGRSTTWRPSYGCGRGLARQGEHQRFALDNINRAISGLQNRNGGFGNYLIVP
jgi:hypothetical protein